VGKTIKTAKINKKQ